MYYVYSAILYLLPDLAMRLTWNTLPQTIPIRVDIPSPMAAEMSLTRERGPGDDKGPLARPDCGQCLGGHGRFGQAKQVVDVVVVAGRMAGGWADGLVVVGVPSEEAREEGRVVKGIVLK